MTRKALVYCTFILLFSVTSRSQAQFVPIFHQSTSGCLYSIQGQLNAGSNFLSNGNLNILRNEPFIDTGQISSLVSALNPVNRAGIHYTINYKGLHGRRTLKAGKHELYLTMSIGYQRMQEMVFSREAGLLLLQGNAPFVGDTLDLGSFRFRALDYLYIKPGVMHARPWKGGVFYSGIYAGINLGMRNIYVNLTKASLYTAPLGEMLAFDSDIQFNRTGNATPSSFDITGVGAGADLVAAFVRPGGFALGVSVSDIGFIRWHKGGYAYHRDSVIVWEGVLIENLFKPGESWGDGIDPDTLDGLFYSYGAPRHHYTMTPTTFKMNLATPVADLPLTLRGALQYRSGTGMPPMATLHIDWKPTPKWILTRSHQIGGYGRHTTGAAVSRRLGHLIWIHAGVVDVYRLLGKELTTSFYGYGGITWRSANKPSAPIPNSL
jgi:hypothetical protein